MKTPVPRTFFSAASLAAALLASASSGATDQPARASNGRAQGLIQHTSLAADRLPPGLASVPGVTAPDEGVVADMALINTLLQQG
ncbi:MAG TPA: hypothetical protein PLL92_07465, partial [Alicycliphilus sp.]|nr:hypothetical protein [Alicycliphilus sp.]